MIDYIKPDIVCGTESWLNGVKPGQPPSQGHIKSSEIFPDNYTVYRNDRNSFGGGVFTLVKNDIVSCEEPDLVTNCELDWVKIKLKQNKDLYIGNFYMPHRNTNDLSELDKSLQKLLSKTSPKNVILVGDFNCPNIDWSNNYVPENAPNKLIQKELINITAEHLTQIHDTPTREKNILDLVFTSNPSLAKSSICIPGLSDHDSIVTDFDIKPDYNKQTRRKIFNYRKANWEKIKTDCLTISHKIIDNITSGSNINSAWDIFKTEVIKSINENVPSRLSSTNTSLPWINHTIRKMIKRKQRLYKQAKKNKSWSNYKTYQREIKREMRKAEYNYVNKQIEEGLKKNDSKPFWRYIKARKQDNIGVSPLKDKGHLINDSLGKANLLLKQFQSVFTQENPNDTLPNIDAKNIKHPLSNIKIDINGVCKLLKNLDTSKSNGPDLIPNTILKTCADELAPGLSAIFQHSLNSGSLPTDWLKANISSAFKKGNKHLTENYRPISLTCVSCKLLEHIICRHLMKHLESNKILTNLNHGFRSGFSCESQLIVTMDDLLHSYDNNTQVDCAILDFSKAFDTVPHRKLLHKLTSYGIHGPIHSWITEFLTKRTMQVVLEGQTTEQVTVDSGVPQGTVLGPILFLCHINDLPDCVQSQTRLFADDCLLYREIKCQQDHTILQHDLHKLETWAQTWGMHFNAKKCYILSIKNKSKHFYNLGNTVLEQVKSNPYLGVTISEDLKWHLHISNISKKANSTLGFLRRNLRHCPMSSKLNAYISLIRPSLEYGTVIWDPYHKSDINTLERIQHRAARFITNNYHTREPGTITSMLKELKLPTLEKRRSDIRLTYFYKIVEEKIPPIHPRTYLEPKKQGRKIKPKTFNEYETTNTTLTNSMTNNNRSFKIIRPNTDAYKYSFFPRTTIEWNHLNNDSVHAKSVEAFKASLISRD